jgi:hypothetical protein
MRNLTLRKIRSRKDLPEILLEKLSFLTITLFKHFLLFGQGFSKSFLEISVKFLR